MHEIVWLQSLVARSNVPREVIFILSTSQLDELHKLDPHAQAERVERGEDLSTRPVAKGGELLKSPFNTLLRSKAADKVRKRIQPIQLSCGARQGSSVMAFTGQAAYKRGLPVLLDDFQSAFNKTGRQALLASSAKVFPESTALVNLAYGMVTIVFYSYFDEDRDEHCLYIQRIVEGVLQGCVLQACCLPLLPHHCSHPIAPCE